MALTRTALTRTPDPIRPTRRSSDPNRPTGVTAGGDFLYVGVISVGVLCAGGLFLLLLFPVTAQLRSEYFIGSQLGVQKISGEVYARSWVVEPGAQYNLRKIFGAFPNDKYT